MAIFFHLKEMERKVEEHDDDDDEEENMVSID